MNSFVGKANGKFILLGEHFVVPSDHQTETVPAIAFPLRELSCQVKITPSEYPHYRVLFDGSEKQDRDAIEAHMARAAYAAADSLRIDISSQPFSVESKANFPISRGFGSSAAFAVALARAFDSYRKSLIHEDADWQELLKATLAVEKIYHGKPSGLDTSVILADRPILFEAGMIQKEIVNNAVDFVAVDSGSRDHCSSMVAEVAKIRAARPEYWNQLAKTMRQLASHCENGLRTGDAMGVAEVVQQAHAVLSELNLSNPTIDGIIQDSKSFGAISGKVSGAGGGGAVLLITRRGDGQKLAEAMRSTGRLVVAVDTVAGTKEN